MIPNVVARPRTVRRPEVLDKTDDMRNFTVRFSESALRRVESTAKPFYGGRMSTGEAIRRLAEERLDQIESSCPRESTEKTLSRLLSAWRSGQLLSLSDLRWLAQATNEAYQRCTRDFVSKELLVANVSAFTDAVRLAPQGDAKGTEPEERYFRRNLEATNDIVANTLPEYVDQWIAQLADHPLLSQAEAASRCLVRYLQEVEFTNHAQLAKTLAQYVPALLEVAIRGYWETQDAPLIARSHGSPPHAARTFTAGDVCLSAQVRQDGVEATLEMHTHGCEITLRNFVELEDLIEITRLAATGVEASAGSFGWLIGSGQPKCYRLSCERTGWRLKANDFESLGKCLELLSREAWMVALAERLRNRYGRI